MLTASNIDILEDHLRNNGDLLGILLIDRTTEKNIIWGTDSYMKIPGDKFSPKESITSELITGKFDKIIQPRAVKSNEEQIRRTKDKAEIFTPLHIVKKINNFIDEQSVNYPVNINNWKDYISEIKLEVCCGEAPFIVTRYNPTTNTRKLIRLSDRVGFLDKKFQVISRFCTDDEDWIAWSKMALKSTYGYEWQGDSLLIARENILYTFIDYFKDKFKKNPSIEILIEISEIISWNLWQMDGVRYVVPMSCNNQIINIKPQMKFKLFNDHPVIQKNVIDKKVCNGCKFGINMKHNGIYSKVKYWSEDRSIRFADLIINNQVENILKRKNSIIKSIKND